MNADELRDALRKMLLIRRAEEQVIHFAQDYEGLIRGHYHVYIGQEATGVAVCRALQADDYLFTTHRNHGHVLARGGKPGPVLAEIIGRTTGYNHGRGGTFHVAAPELGIVQTSAIVGGCIPLAVGAGYSIKRLNQERVSLVFFGDGVLEEGAFYEGLNIASLWKLPVVFLCENNDVPAPLRAGGDHASESLAAKKLTEIAAAFRVPGQVIDGSDLEAVHGAAQNAVARVRGGEGPVFLEVRTTRWPGNMAQFPDLKGSDFDMSWAWEPEKAPEVFHDWLRDSDPVSLLARKVVSDNTAALEELEAMDAAVRKEVAEAARFALESPAPAPERALERVFV